MPSDLLKTRLRKHFNTNGVAKRGYDTFEEAQQAATEAPGASNRRPYRAYRCDCGKYHFGHKPASKHEKQRARARHYDPARRPGAA